MDDFIPTGINIQFINHNQIPDTPARPAFAVWIRMEPEEVDVLGPDNRMMLPPYPVKDIIIIIVLFIIFLRTVL